MKKTRSAKSKPAAVAEPPLALLADERSVSALRSQTGWVSRAWAWLQSRQSAGADSRRLRVAETVSLGEKRFVAVVQVAGRDFLVAGGPSNIALLAQLNPNEPFEDVLRRTMTIPSQPPAKRKRAVKRKQKPKAAKPALDLVAKEEPQQLPMQKSIKPVRKQAAKAKPAAVPASQNNGQDNGHAAPETAPVVPPFSVPESFRYVLQNSVATDSNGTSKPANHQNGRSETEHTGHWA